METRTVLIADPSEDITLALEALLQPGFQVLRCCDGPEALALTERVQPDLLIMELSLPQMDGIALLRQLSRREAMPKILVLTAATTDFALCALREFPVDYLLRKPAPAAMVAERAREILLDSPEEPLDWCASDLLIRLGIPEHLQGFRHLVVGLPLLAQDPGQFLGKTLYLEIARRNRVTNESVEKAIRDAIRAGWNRGDRALWRQYFPGITQAPQNKPFLIRMAGILCRCSRCG